LLHIAVRFLKALTIIIISN